MRLLVKKKVRKKRGKEKMANLNENPNVGSWQKVWYHPPTLFSSRFHQAGNQVSSVPIPEHRESIIHVKYCIKKKSPKVLTALLFFFFFFFFCGENVIVSALGPDTQPFGAIILNSFHIFQPCDNAVTGKGWHTHTHTHQSRAPIRITDRSEPPPKMIPICTQDLFRVTQKKMKFFHLFGRRFCDISQKISSPTPPWDRICVERAAVITHTHTHTHTVPLLVLRRSWGMRERQLSDQMILRKKKKKKTLVLVILYSW
ncbi:hypothetical protein QBC38DRAFT_191036 [Podospora fimiseda]|uniref:Uncharacterized protein n=1 Tax=Podospora fimiseda TaxID=252190 RepID=A0AAN7BR31_9PEZI|nr:hypothetical protein QBC38DRAFT_191036 [Podospora fimiseda]